MNNSLVIDIWSRYVDYNFVASGKDDILTIAYYTYLKTMY